MIVMMKEKKCNEVGKLFINIFRNVCLYIERAYHANSSKAGGGNLITHHRLFPLSLKEKLE